MLYLTLGDDSWPLDTRPLTIGRLPECDVVVADAHVSRSHAYVIPTPDGPLLVDRSRSGTLVNGAARSGPSFLVAGDELAIGNVLLLIRSVPGRISGDASPTGRALSNKLRQWVRRYGPSEVFGTLAAVGVAVLVQRATGNTVAAAYLGAISENVAFYGIMFLRESIKEAHHAGRHGRPYRWADTMAVLRNMGLEFGAAELLDTGLLRPLFIGLGLRFLGGPLGAFVGKLVADVAFYGPVLATYEWRLARRQAIREDQRRRTTATRLSIPEE